MSLPIVALAVFCAFTAWAAYTYNFMIHARAKVHEALSGVDVQLKLRHDLIPNLNELVRGYSDHESEALRASAVLRSRAIAARRASEIEELENTLAREVSRVVGLAEENPRLKASPEYAELAEQLRATEDEIQSARELYNSNAEFYNSRAQRFPAMLVASFMRPRGFGYLRLDPIDLDPLAVRVGEFAA
jgi:LemA protein